MRTRDHARIAAPLERVFEIAADVERWPAFLGHYRWVRMRRRTETGGVVEMAAWRPFGVFNYPTWWIAEMDVLPERRVIRYKHIDGITQNMDVEWRFHATGGGVDVTIVHEWRGPRWPLIGRVAADWVIGPIFIHGIAARTLAGVKRRAEAA